ncbi:hypothetical protein COT47_07355 [Candidatus Woesearchaeota archaeon CG08_land_8_20_14_0_20_43_7]|nr:MAG: hypothetical protein COT47_07355 [Candidatus Woesearchaeota archaeon CG08_land_8_20_14_0_20_43_7]
MNNNIFNASLPSQSSIGRLFVKSFTAFIMLSIAMLIFKQPMIISLFIILGIISMYPIKHINWLGVELCFFFTVFTSMQFGAIPGIIVASMILIITGVIYDLIGVNFAYELIAFFIIAVFSSFFNIIYIASIGMLLLILYHVGSAIFQKTMSMFDFESILFMLTNISFNMFILFRIAPYIVKILT